MDPSVSRLLEAPEDLGDWQSEYRAIVERCGLALRSDRCMVRVCGERRAEMLNGLVTNQITGLEGIGRHAMLLNPKGRVLSDLRIFPLPNFILVDVPRRGLPNLLDAFRKYLPPIYASFEDAGDSLSLLGLYGPEAPEAAGRVLGLVAAEHLGIFEVEIDGVPALVVRNRRLAGDGVEIFVPREALAAVSARLLLAAQEREGRAVGARALDVVRVECGVPVYGIDMGEANLAQETGLEEEAISYDKGCYLGQEVVARVHFRGHVNRQLRGLEFAGGMPAAAMLLRDGAGKEVGQVTSAVESPQYGPIGLGYVRREIGTGEDVLWFDEGRERRGTVIELPFRKCDLK